MFSLILLVVFGLGMAYFATQNTGIVHITIANLLISDVPLYVIVIGSILLGIFISWLISMVDSISSMLTLHGKEAKIKDANKTIESLKEENQKLLLKIAELKGEQVEPQVTNEDIEETEEPSIHPSLFHRLRHSFG